MKAFPNNRSEGMELRDYFAAKSILAAVEMLTAEFNQLESGTWTWHDQDFNTVAERAYKIADAMIKTREKL
jgi:hypothetical protein